MVDASRSIKKKEVEENNNPEEQCIFCDMANNKIPVEKIYENDSFFSVYDKNQDIKGHALVISKKHYKNILELPEEVSGKLTDCIKKTSSKLMQEDVKGFNLVNNTNSVAGQVINHLHFHILPRRDFDGVNIPC